MKTKEKITCPKTVGIRETHRLQRRREKKRKGVRYLGAVFVVLVEWPNFNVMHIYCDVQGIKYSLLLLL